MNENDKKIPTSMGGDVQKKAIEELARTQNKALDKAPSKHAGIIQIALFVAIVCAVLGGALIYKDQPSWGFGAIVACVLALAAAMYFIRPEHLPSGEPKEPSVSVRARTSWSRVTIKLPVPVEPLNKLSGSLQVIRNVAQTKYSNLLTARNVPAIRIVPERVRINVFLPDTEDAIYGEVCGLFIPKGLHHGMLNDAERRVRFRPNEGLTGRVFTMEKAFGARRDSADSEWQQIYLEGMVGTGDEKFQLTLEQINLIDKDLRWIVSFPLKIPRENISQTFAVLNVDGFTEALTPDEMQSLYNHLKDTIDQFALEVSKLDKSRITITLEDI